MSTATDKQWGADRNRLVKQSLIGEHMVRVTLEHVYRSPTQEEQLTRPGRTFEIRTHTNYYVTIGLFWKYGNGSNNKWPDGTQRYHEWTSRRVFALGPLAWQYGVRLAKGATQQRSPQ